MMIEKFKILGKYIKDMSSETPNIETFLFVKENISKYQLNIDITSRALKNKLIEINTTLKLGQKILQKDNSVLILPNSAKILAKFWQKIVCLYNSLIQPD